MRALWTLTLALPLLAQAPKPEAPALSAKQADIRKLLLLTDQSKLAVQTMTEMLGQQKSANPNVPEVFWTEFMAEFTAGKLDEMIAPIYDAQLTHAEIQAMIRFYSTPEGAAVVKKMPLILKASMEAGQKLGAETGRRVAERLQAEGKM